MQGELDGRWMCDMVGCIPDRGNALTPQPSLTLSALRQAVATVAPEPLPEMFVKMQQAFVQAGNQGSVTPIRMFYREWAVIVEIERYPETARRLHAAEQALMSDDVRSETPPSATQVRSCVPRTAQWPVSDWHSELHSLLPPTHLAT